jgi:hypothetical protein
MCATKEPSGEGWKRHYGTYPKDCPDGACDWYHAKSGLLVMSEVTKQDDKCRYFLSVTKLPLEKVKFTEAMMVADTFGLKKANYRVLDCRYPFERLIFQDVED